MNELEDFIRKEQDALASATPQPGHEARFRKKLKKSTSKPLNTGLWWAAAAIAGLVFLLQPSPKTEVTAADETTTAPLEQIAPEVADVEAYYSQQIERSYSEIQESGSDLKMDLLDQHLGELERDYEMLKAELYRTNGEQRVIERMIENYITRLQILQKHGETLNQYNNTKPEHHEDA